MLFTITHLEEPEADADEAEVFRRLRARLGETERPSFFLGDLDRRQGSFHSSALFDCAAVMVVASFSFFGGSGWRLEKKRGVEMLGLLGLFYAIRPAEIDVRNSPCILGLIKVHCGIYSIIWGR